MIKLIEKIYSVPQGKMLLKFIVDSADDIADLPPCACGSTAIVATGGEYIVNTVGEWVKRVNTSGGGVNVTDAKYGQLIVVKEVDANGAPTAWETMDRTHWAEHSVEEVLAECQPTFIESDNMFLITEGVTLLSVGEEYIVNWNGVEYNCIGQDVPGLERGVLLGNTLPFDNTDTGEPFAVASALNEGVSALIIMAMDGTTELTISICHEGEIVHKLDPKYIPNDTPKNKILNLMGSAYNNLDTFETDLDGLLNVLNNGGNVWLKLGEFGNTKWANGRSFLVTSWVTDELNGVQIVPLEFQSSSTYYQLIATPIGSSVTTE